MRVLSILAILCAVFVLSTTAYGQQKALIHQANDGTASAIARGVGKPAIIVVSNAAKMAWGTTKFAGKYVLKPVAKSIFLKAAPAVGKFVLKKSVKYILPNAAKYSLL